MHLDRRPAPIRVLVIFVVGQSEIWVEYNLGICANGLLP